MQNSCFVTQHYSLWGPVQVPGGHFAETLKNPDAISVALELGRLDLVSALLTVLGIILALASLFGFWALKAGAMKAAHEAARSEIKDRLPEMLPVNCVSTLQGHPEIVVAALKSDPTILISALRELGPLREVLFGDIDNEEADRIAKDVA